jgi:hypothetical protein
MIDECDEMREDDWPNDDEANNIILAYAAEDELKTSRSGCAGAVLAITFITFSFIWAMFT